MLDLVDRLGTGAFRLELRWALEGGEEPPELGLPWLPQQGRDLGERLWRGLNDAAAGGTLVAAVGSDHPDLAAEQVEAAFRALEEGAEVVIGPATDGGYYLIAFRPDSLRRELFEGIPWSSPAVCATTLERCRDLALRAVTLPVASDIDTAADLDGLVATPTALSPRTRAWLARWSRGSAA